MSVVRKTYACDWPGCTAEITIPGDWIELSDAGWERRGNIVDDGHDCCWHACPEHRFRTTADFREAIDRARVEGEG